MFSNGITNLTLLTAAKWVGVTFLLSMFTISSQGQLFWSNINKRLQPTGEIVSTKRGLHQKYKISEDSTVAINEEVLEVAKIP